MRHRRNGLWSLALLSAVLVALWAPLALAAPGRGEAPAGVDTVAAAWSGLQATVAGWLGALGVGPGLGTVSAAGGPDWDPNGEPNQLGSTLDPDGNKVGPALDPNGNHLGSTLDPDG